MVFFFFSQAFLYTLPIVTFFIIAYVSSLPSCLPPSYPASLPSSLLHSLPYTINKDSAGLKTELTQRKTKYIAYQTFSILSSILAFHCVLIHVCLPFFSLFSPADRQAEAGRRINTQATGLVEPLTSLHGNTRVNTHLRKKRKQLQKQYQPTKGKSLSIN